MSAKGGSARRAGFAASVAAGLSLMALSVGGMATLDDELQAAAQPPANERVVIETRETKLKAGDDRDCPGKRRGEREDAPSPDAT